MTDAIAGCESCGFTGYATTADGQVPCACNPTAQLEDKQRAFEQASQPLYERRTLPVRIFRCTCGGLVGIGESDTYPVCRCPEPKPTLRRVVLASTVVSRRVALPPYTVTPIEDGARPVHRCACGGLIGVDWPTKHQLCRCAEPKIGPVVPSDDER